jgi:putative molybdopterin biosynthesis protein
MATLRIAGSDDPLFAWLTRELGFTTQIVGSYGGIWALQRRDADAATLHLQDADTHEYNAPFVRHLLPEGDWVLVNIAWRENGLIVARGNPRRIRGVRDLARRSVRIVNRQRDAGTRVLLMRELRRAGIDPASISGVERCVATHGAVADMIALGLADAGPGLRAAAAARGLDFVPLAPERYDIAFPREVFDSRPAQELFDALSSRAFHDEAARLQGYDLRDCGRVVAEARGQYV